MKKAICLVVSFVLLLATTACTRDVVDSQLADQAPELEVLPNSEAQYLDSIRTFEATMEASLQSDGYSSAAVAILEDGEIIYSSGFGTADRDTRIAPTGTDTIYNIGSVSKVYVAAALLKLQEDGALSLDDPVVKHLPEFTMADNRYEDITVRMLLNHTAGLPSNAYMRGAALIDSDPDYGYYDSLIKVLADTTPTSDPGAYPAYSNDGFVLAQKIVERTSGMDYASYLNDQFFLPMGLNHTSLSSTADSERIVKVYDSDGTALPREVMIDDLAGAGAIAATAEDVCSFIGHLFSPESGVLSVESVAELRSIQNTDSVYGERSTLNGLGWDYSLHPANSVQVLSKNGGTTVYSSQVLTAPDAGLTVVGLCAGFPDTSPIYSATNQLMLDILVEKGYSVYGNEVDKRDETEAPTNLSEYTGYYIPSSGPLYHCQVNGETLTLSIWSGDGQWTQVDTVSYRQDGTFGHDLEDTGGTYIGYCFVEKDGAVFVAQCIESDSGASENIVFQKLTENPVSADWSGLGGLWLRKDASYDEYQLFGLAAIYMGDTAPLDGYVDFGGSMFRVLDDISAGAAAESVCGNGELRRTDDGLLFSGDLYVPAITAATLEDAGQIELGSGTRWYHSEKELSITLNPDVDTRLLAYDAQGNLFFDSIGGTYTLTLPEDCYLMVCCA